MLNRVLTELTNAPLLRLRSARRVQFSEITQASFPPVFERFLSVIGIFTFDLGWIASAACLTSGIDFFDKLMSVKFPTL